MLGAIPPLVGKLDLEDFYSHITSLHALLNLGIINDANKVAFTKIGEAYRIADCNGLANISVILETNLVSFLVSMVGDMGE
ncbi:hypothetical protein VNO77_08822 [Canavalia gladiata]|uniref:Uncharacterized protein n=1 Tax=Canavalia gladiata TaxID=3824 RepID=A0AAN9QWB1_CANGL